MKNTKYIQITSGRGPVECTWVVAQVLKIMLQQARDIGFKAQVIHKVKGTENGTLVSVVVELRGIAPENFIQQWEGTVQWIGKSQYRKNHKRKNWFVGVNEINLPATLLQLNDSDLHYQTARSSGAGGQHVNKVETAVRLTHLPSGLSVTCSETRSQHQNRKYAKEKLQKLLQVHQLEISKKELNENWQNHNELKRGNPIKVFRGSDFKSKKQSKTYKTQRNQLKKELKNELKQNLS